MIAFVSAALATTCDAFSLGVTPSVMQHKGLPFMRQQKPLRAFASDRGESASENAHFSISSDPGSASTLSQESTTTPIAPPPMARPAENNKLAMVDKTANGVPAAAPPGAVEGEGEPVERQQSVWERSKAADVQGGSLRTWSFADQHKIDMIQVHMKTDGRPMNANVELWQGPDNVPQKVSVYVEDGRARPFRCFVATPYSGNSISIRNTNTLEYPLQAILEGGKVGMDDPETKEKMQRIQTTKPKICQGGATITERFNPEVQSVQVFLQSEGRPMECRIELIQGPNNVKQVMEVYTEEGSIRPFYAIIETPGYGTGVVRIINSSTMEFPFTATVQPWNIGLPDDDFDARSTGGSPFFEISGGMGMGNNLRDVGSPPAEMGGMFGSFAISGSPSSSTPTNAESQGSGLAGLFASSDSAPSPSPARDVERKMVAPKTSSPPPTTAEPARDVERKMVAPKTSSPPPATVEPAPAVESEMVTPKTSSPPPTTVEPAPAVEREMVTPKTSSPPPTTPEPAIFLQNEEFANSSSKSSLSQDTTPIITTTARSKTPSPKKSTTIPAPEADPVVPSDLEDEPGPKSVTKRYVPPSSPAPSPAAPVAKRYVPPSPPPAPKQSSHVFLDIDDAFK